MAVVDTTALTNALSSVFEPKSVEQMNRAAVLTTLLSFRQGEGKNLQFNAIFGDEAYTDATINEGADFSTWDADTPVPAVLQWGTYGASFSMTGKALAAARTTNQDIADLCRWQLQTVITKLAKSINRDLYTGSGATNYIHGMLAANGPLRATGTYAGINRATYPQWASNYFANGGTPRALTVALMRDTRRAIYEACGEPIDLIVTSPIQHEKYGLSFGDQRHYMQNISLRGQNITLDAGYRALEFDGIPVVQDTDCPDGTMLFLNTRHITLRQLPGGPCCFVNGDGPGYIRLHGTYEEQFGNQMSQLTARIMVLAVSGDYCKVGLVLYPQLMCDRPNSCGVLTDLITT